jgi:hypothetical protein
MRPAKIREINKMHGMTELGDEEGVRTSPMKFLPLLRYPVED